MEIIKNKSTMSKILTMIFLVLLCLFDRIHAQSVDNQTDFSSAQIVVSAQLSTPEKAALQTLTEEVKKRTLFNLTHASHWPAASTPAIVIGTKENLKGLYGTFSPSDIGETDASPEGFAIKLIRGSRQAPTLFVIGNDSRGMLFGIGYLLRKAIMKHNSLEIPDDINITTHPAMPLRGHQLGYRPKTNAYDGFTSEMWEQYIRDLTIFGTNSIELLPPHTDDIPDSPMFPRPQIDMMVKMDKIIQKYGLNAWIWYPMMYGDYSKSENVKKSLKENEMIFKKLPKIDAVFVPGGDPGHTPPKVMFSYMEKEAKLLHKYHPDAEMWMSPQGFNGSWLNNFYQILKDGPDWLTGIVYGPQLEMSIKTLRQKVPQKYRIRRYPDITHSYASQYAVPNWDFAFAATENREGINPRPTQEKVIFHTTSLDNYYGFLTYSEGINDDVNKTIWSALGWNPDEDVLTILRDYSRYFIGPNFTDSFAQGLLDLEKDWEGPLLGNDNVYTTLDKFKAMESDATPSQRLNWRFQEGMYRAYYDAYDRSRLIYETHLEDKAMSALRNANVTGSLKAMNEAQRILDKALTNPVSRDWKNRLSELAEALFQSIHMQKSVDKYFAKAIRRGANLDLVNYPLNDRIWLEDQFKNIRGIDSEKKRLDAIEKITDWKNPGPGGFYDDLGDLGNQPHLVHRKTYEDDPGFLSSPYVGFTVGDRTKDWRVSWQRYMQADYNNPLKMHYKNLDPTAQYIVKVVYGGDDFDVKIRLTADGDIPVHSYIKKSLPLKPMSFEVPRSATKDGELTLTWNQEMGIGGNGRGCQVAEVWLLKKENAQSGYD